VPEETIVRLESRMGGGQASGRSSSAAAPSGDSATIRLDANRRARLIAFVESNDRMPAERKSRALEQLQDDEVPLTLVERLESRMGG